MGYRLTLFFCLFVVVIVTAFPSEHEDEFRAKRDVMNSMKSAWTEVVKTLGNAGGAVFVVVIVTALPSEHKDGFRVKRDFWGSMKNAWTEVVKTLGTAGDAVANAFDDLTVEIKDLTHTS